VVLTLSCRRLSWLAAQRAEVAVTPHIEKLKMEQATT
jgi:hypothetical protein